MPTPVRTAIELADNEVFVSAVSAMEVTTKHRLGKLESARELALDFEAIVLTRGFQPLPIELSHAQLAGTMEIPHKDPFDRLLIAQAREEGMTLVSNEAVFDGFDVQRLW
jgi:PIN domain nuclease of toxin-antitoxin system